MNNSNQKLMRWSLQLQSYDFEVKYRPGKDLGHADGLSRPAADDEDQNYPPKIPEGGNVKGKTP